VIGFGGLFPNAYHVARREYLTRVRSRTFVVLTAGLALVGLGLALLPLGIRLIGGDKPTTVAVFVTATDLTQDPVATLQSILTSSAGSGGQGTGQATGQASGPKFRVTATNDVADAKADVRADRLDGLLTIGRGTDGDLTFDYFSKASATSQSLLLVQQATGRLAISDRLEQAGVAEADRSRIFAPTAFTATPADPNASRREQDEYVPAYILATVFVVLTFMAVQLYGNWVASSVAEEKSTRVMELLITAATPRQLLAGKVLGTGAAGLTQYAAILVAAGVGFLLQGTLTQRILGNQAGTTGVPALTVPLLIGIGAFFVTGFVLYAILYAAAGSLVSRQEDVQQMAGPLTMLGLGGYLIAFFALNVVDAPWVQVISFVPFLSSFIFPARMVLASPAPWEYALALALMVAAILGALALAARIYAAGVLLYGQRPTLRAVWGVTFARRRA
jgi:ABC-2 type transport system permease protein